jgi:hypothetical protein
MSEGISYPPVVVSIGAKQATVVDYLRSITATQRATASDIRSELNIDLGGNDASILALLLSNPKIEVGETPDGVRHFKYKTKFDHIRDRFSLLAAINAVKSGVTLGDIEYNYPDVQSDVWEMIIGGTIIACKGDRDRKGQNKGLILFPRGESFLVELGGTISIAQGQHLIQTSHDLTDEVKRGDAILVGERWHRVDCSVSDKKKQPERAKPSLSVSMDKVLPPDNKYFKEFSRKRLPLDRDYEGLEPVNTAKALRHGCTNDVRAHWEKTNESEFMGNYYTEQKLEEYLLRKKLISTPGTTSSNSIIRRRRPPPSKAKRRQNKPAQLSTNAHLAGTALGDMLNAPSSNP